MPKSKNPNEDREGREEEYHEQEHHEPGERHQHEDGEKERPRRRRMGREHAVHLQIVDRRLGGGAPATSETYAKALEEWHKLPGSVMRPPTDERPATQPGDAAGDQGDKENRS
jgi:hypothetical protein